MIASIIAYSMAIGCMLVGVPCLLVAIFKAKTMSPGQVVTGLGIFVVFGSMAWGFAYLGGLS
ncbi:hypothetical protein [Rhizobium sp. BK251]|uniref:hypothetical protein n=1 Tax=Rhizobium sp. BK251 TaxID=2512125 RepID=UPI00104887B0|nr:hypothetical protein [Rhizobium sp. BK251]TCL70605.1 hypothetical protein EV286_107482 [Rhizobium sp. BK251]